jgi:drug/metabolite transporter (DMT)-like permease
MTSPPDSARSHRASLLLMLGSAACFIANVLLIRALGTFTHASLWVVTSSRFVVGLLIVSTLYRREFKPAHLLTNRKLIERGLLGGVCTLGFYYTVTRLGAGRATFINNTYVVWAGLFAVWALRERLRPALVIGATATLLGLGLLTNPFAGGSHTGVFDFIALLNAFGSAWIVVTIRKLQAREHSSTIFAAQCAFGLLICGGPALGSLPAISPAAWCVLIIASICAGAGQLLMTRAYRDLSVAEGSLLQMPVPLGIAAGGTVFSTNTSARWSCAAGFSSWLAAPRLPYWAGPGPPDPPPRTQARFAAVIKVAAAAFASCAASGRACMKAVTIAPSASRLNCQASVSAS